MSLNYPNPILNEEELDLLGNAPEDCLRHVVQRGALSLDHVTEGLSPRVTAILQSIVTGERSPALPAEGDELEWLPAGRNQQPSRQRQETTGPPPQHAGLGYMLVQMQQAMGHPPTEAQGKPAQPATDRDIEGSSPVRNQLAAHPQILDMVDRQVLTPNEAWQAVHAIDRILGRYLTGTLYAAP